MRRIWNWLRFKPVFCAAAALLAAATMPATTPASAQQGAAFFKDKTLTYIVATAPGGNYDTYARLIAEFMQKHLPGSTVIVKNMPGAGHIIGANAVFASKPDGLTIGTFNTGLIYNQLVKLSGVKFDLEKMSWIGKAAADPRVFVISDKSPIKAFTDLKAQTAPVNFAAAGIGSASFVETTMLTNALKLPIKVLTGYNGSDDQLAMRRGEVAGSIASRSSWEQFVKNGYGHFIVQIGGNEKDIPQLAPMVTDQHGKELVALIQSQGDIARLTAGPPGIPKDRLDALRAAYKAALEDKDLLEKAKKLEIPIEPLYGDDVGKAVTVALTQSPETIAVLKDALAKK